MRHEVYEYMGYDVYVVYEVRGEEVQLIQIGLPGAGR